MSRILLTGASGHLGRHVLAQLAERGHTVLAVTSRPTTMQPQYPGVEWHRMDFLDRTPNFNPLVKDCEAVLHLAAELHRPDNMQRTNVQATRMLATASEAAGVKVFCYISSVAVYGSSLQRLVTEDSPVLTTDEDIASEYWQDATMRCYGRTKLQGEKAIQEIANIGGGPMIPPTGQYVILRPTLVVDIDDMINFGNWSSLHKSLASARNSHFIYVRDAADAILWFMERGLRNPAPGVSIFNLADDSIPGLTLGSFFKQAYEVTGDARFRVRSLPWQLDHLRAIITYHKLPLRHTFGRMIFSTEKLRKIGYRLRFGMGYAMEQAFDEIRRSQTRTA